MDWIKQNTFLATFGGIMLLGILGLGFFAFSSWNGYSAAINDFDSTRTKLTGLEGAPLHPNDAKPDYVTNNLLELEKRLRDAQSTEKSR